MPAAEDTTVLQFTARTVFVALRCWWKFVVPAALLLATAAGSAVYLLHEPKYTAESWLLIKDKPDVILKEVAIDSQRFIQNQLEIIRSPRLLGPLASNPAVVSTPELRREIDVAKALAKRLKIAPRNDSDIYEISFTSASPEKAELIVREVVNAYLAFNRKLDTEQQNQIIRLLEDQREARYEEMTQLRETVRSLSMELTGVDPFRTGAKQDEPSKLNAAMASLQADIVRYEVAQDILAAHIKAEEERGAASQADLVPDLEQEIETHPDYLARKESLEELKKRDEEFRRAGKGLAENGLYRQLQSRIAAEKKALDDLATELRADLLDGVERRAEWERQEKLKSLKAEFATGATRLKILKEKFDKHMGTARQVAGDTLGLEFHRAKLEQVTKIHDEISARILAITTEQRAPERVMAFKEASLPLRPDQTIPWQNIALAATAAFCLPFGAAVLWEHFFRRVSGRQEVESTQLISVVGEVTSLPSRYGRRVLPAHAPHRDAQLFEESVDSLRTYLEFVDDPGHLNTIAVASAVSGEGKTSLAAQLAISVERANGTDTLIIDGDMRSPDLHDMFGVPLTPGLAELLNNECTLDEAIHATSRDNIYVLPAGRLTTSPHRLLKNGAFARLLDGVKERFAHVVIDTPPILPASEAIAMARCADSAVLCMRRDYSRLSQVQEAQHRLKAAGTKTAGAVINGIPVSLYARKYGCYAYGAADVVSGS